MFIFLLPLIPALAGAIKGWTDVPKAETTLVAAAPVVVVQEPKVQEAEPEEWEGLYPYPGSLANFWDEEDLIERTLRGQDNKEFRDLSKDMEEFLCTCDPEVGFDTQKALILLMTTINCSYGNNNAFPRNPFLLESIFEEGIGILKGTVCAAARDNRQRHLGGNIADRLSVFLRKEGVLARTNF